MRVGDSLRRQALILTLANGATRAVGFALHLMLARLMGAEALGVMELANTVGMLALTPVTAGIPAAMSRLTARRPACDQENVLRAGIRLVARMAAVLMPALLLLSPLLGWLLGDSRTLPSILLTVPDVLLLGLCAAYSGYCYGRDNAKTPAVCECAEQGVRFLLCAGLLLFLPQLPIRWTAALPGIAEGVAGVVAVLLMRRAMPLAPRLDKVSGALTRQLFRLSAPTTAARLCMTGSRALGAVLLPVCLRRSGLSASAATAQFGLLNGMAMPLIMLPGIVTSAVCMVATPAVSRLEGSPEKLTRTARQLSLAALAVGAAAACGLFLLADFLANALYAQPALAPLVRALSPAALCFALHQVTHGMIAGLGLQKRALGGTLLSCAVNLAMIAWLCPLPRLRLFGAAAACIVSHLTGLCWDAALLRRALRRARLVPLPVQSAG